MATTPEEVQQQPKGVQRVIERITAPVSDQNGKQRVAFAVAAAAATTAPQPFAGVLAAILLALAFDRKR
jgi:hypothetical protein